jgi:hypothetical protein
MSPLSSIFLCYRRDDTEGEAGRVQESLERQLSSPRRKTSVFMDQTSIPSAPYGRRWSAKESISPRWYSYSSVETG